MKPYYIAFARADRLELLLKLFKKITIPEAVYREVVERGKDKPGAEVISQAEWIKVESVREKDKVTSVPRQLASGEAEAIILAEELGAVLLVDDLRARIEAKKRGLNLSSSIDILLEAKMQGLIQSVKQMLDELIATGFRLSDVLYHRVLHEAGEIDEGKFSVS